MTVGEAVAELLAQDQNAELVIRIPGEIDDSEDELEPHAVFVDRYGSHRDQMTAAFRGTGQAPPPVVVLKAGEDGVL